MSGDKATSANAGPAHPDFGYYGMVAFQPQSGGKLCKRPDFMKPFQISLVKNGAIGRPDRIWHWKLVRGIVMRKSSLTLLAAAIGLAASQAWAADLPRKAPAYVP